MDQEVRWRWHPGILEQLRAHGFVPKATSDPEAVYEWLKSLYAFEIRDLKLRRREAERVLGKQPLDIYRRQLTELKARYEVLAIPGWHWVERTDEELES